MCLMKLKITTELPLEEKVKPPVGSIHEIIDYQESNFKKHKREIFFINYNGEKVGVFPHECEILTKETNE